MICVWFAFVFIVYLMRRNVNRFSCAFRKDALSDPIAKEC
jgi:hypothetical protein